MTPFVDSGPTTNQQSVRSTNFVDVDDFSSNQHSWWSTNFVDLLLTQNQQYLSTGQTWPSRQTDWLLLKTIFWIFCQTLRTWRTKEGGHSCISRGPDPVQCGPGWLKSTLPGYWNCARHAPRQTTSQHGPLQRQEGVQHPGEHRINMFVVSGYLHRNVLFVVSTGWLFWLVPP